MALRLRIVACLALLLIASLWVSAACSAMNQPDDMSVGGGVIGLFAAFLLLPWCFTKLLRWKGKPDA